MGFEGGGTAIYQITASVVKLSFKREPLPLRHLNLNVSADLGKNHITSSTIRMFLVWVKLLRK